MGSLTADHVDGALVIRGGLACSGAGALCESCQAEIHGLHNWLREHRVPYLIVDFEDARRLCSTLIEELVLLRRRLGIEMMVSGVWPDEARDYLRGFRMRPFSLPEDAVRALRLQFPGVTETPLPEFLLRPVPA